MAAIKDESQHRRRLPRPDIKDAGVTKIECPDDSTFIAYTTDQSDRIFQVYVPILPKHVWSKFNYKNIDKEKFDAPLVGTGPYTLAESKTDQFARFVRNPNYWGNQGFADEVVLQFFPDADTMVQALKAGELDYAHGVNADQFKQLQADPTYTAVAGKANGWTPAGVQHLRNRHRQDDQGRRPVDQGAARPGLPRRPRLRGRQAGPRGPRARWLRGRRHHQHPARPVRVARRAGQPPPLRHRARQAEARRGRATCSNGDGKRLDKEGKPIQLRLYFPNTDDVYAKSAQFVSEWYGQLGIDVTLQGFGSTALGNIVLPPEGDGKANYDIELWGWGGNPDPNAPAGHLHAAARSARRRTASTATRRSTPSTSRSSKEAGTRVTTTLAKMQNLIYDEAPYDILFYDANLDVYRNDKFAGWENMPADGTPLFYLRHASTTPCSVTRRPSRRPPRRPRPRRPPQATRAVRSGGGDGGAQRHGRDRRSRQLQQRFGQQHDAAARAGGRGRRRGRGRARLLPPPIERQRRGRIAASMTRMPRGGRRPAAPT